MANNIQEVLPRMDGQMQQSVPVTTISTVAIQAGEARIILVILKVSWYLLISWLWSVLMVSCGM